MATYRIHEDQENRGISELRLKHANMAPNVQKRAVLGSLQNKNVLIKQNNNKQPLGVSNSTSFNLTISNKFDVKPPPPVVPVAQFEAFKVYEDSKENDVPQLDKVKGSQNEQLVSKRQWFAQDAKSKEHDARNILEETQNNSKIVESNDDLKIELPSLNQNDEKKSDTLIIESPMSIEKPQIVLETKPIIVRGGRLSRDKFFELEEYRTEIFMYLRELELHNRPKPAYMRKQPDITYNMRTILVDWLVEVAQEYKLQSETLFLAVNYIDRFLSYMSVVRGKLQLVGTAAMFVAAKYEEIYPPDVSEFVYITDDTYTKKQVIRMEQLILKVLSFDLSVPTPLTFITAMSISTGLPDQAMYLAMYLSELAMLETDPYLETLPSVLAAASIAVARYTLKLEPWTSELKRKTGYETKDFKRAMEFLYVLFSKAPTLTQRAIPEKYSSSQYMHVSKLVARSEDIKLE
ncbi:hypothetical protein FQR65_LT08672 [Abscondita terminalis]|nr:hypothetical protein FQR65_LT08672 [Abscondita terminalis]